jgi:L-iditol 2-dehydrogenase
VAARAGVLRVFDPAAGEGPGAARADIVIDGVGVAATRAAACRAVRRGGVIAHIGLASSEGGLDVRRITLEEIAFVGCYTYTPEDFRQTAQAIFDGRMGALDWIETRPLAEGARAFADLRAGRVAAPKIVLLP